MALSISIPKVVIIENTRLALLYYVLMIAVCFGAVYITISEKKYLVRQKPTTFPSMYVTTPSLESLNARIANYTGPNADSICQDENFNFKFSDDFTYEDITCKQLPQALSFSKVSGTTFFFPTYYSDEHVFQEQNNATASSGESKCEKLSQLVPLCTATIKSTPCYKSDNCGTTNKEPSCYCSIRKKTQFWTLGVELIRVSLMHRYEVQKGGISFASEDDDGKEKGSTKPSGQQVGIRTYIMQNSKDGSGKTSLFDCGKPKAKLCYFDPGQEITLTLEEIISAAGIKLTDLNTDQQTQNASPPFRLTGAEVSITAEYKNPHFHYDYDGIDSDGPATHCYVHITANTGWTSRIENTEVGAPQMVQVDTNGAGTINPNFDSISNVEVRQRYQQGISLNFIGASTSEFGFFDFPALAAIIAVFLLYIGVVPLLIKLIAIYLLGNTSRTYKRAQQEVLQVQESCQREFPAKMLTATMVFYMISTIEQMGKKGVSISRRGLESEIGYDVLAHLLRHCLHEEKDLDEGETKNIILSIYEQLGGADGKVSLNEFIRAFTHSEVFDMEALIKTYDVQRKRNCIEYIFADATDRAVAKERKEREKAGENMSLVVDAENPEVKAVPSEGPDSDREGKGKGKGRVAKGPSGGSTKSKSPTGSPTGSPRSPS